LGISGPFSPFFALFRQYGLLYFSISSLCARCFFDRFVVRVTLLTVNRLLTLVGVWLIHQVVMFYNPPNPYITVSKL
jgi:hypothetical protein